VGEPLIDSVNIARCKDHGLHGQRTECFTCGLPVEQVPMVAVADLRRLRDIEVAALQLNDAYLSPYVNSDLPDAWLRLREALAVKHA
jgi:hypothetical protein